MTQTNLSHLNAKGEANMVDVSEKEMTTRIAIAEGYIYMKKETLAYLLSGVTAKGDVLATARLAGIMGAKKTSDLIPLCHPLPLSKVQIDFEILEKQTAIKVQALAKTDGKTGVEMEALTAVSVTCLTLYDMLKAVDKTMTFQNIRLLEKSGGRSGHFKAS